MLWFSIFTSFLDFFSILADFFRFFTVEEKALHLGGLETVGEVRGNQTFQRDYSDQDRLFWNGRELDRNDLRLDSLTDGDNIEINVLCPSQGELDFVSLKVRSS